MEYERTKGRDRILQRSQSKGNGGNKKGYKKLTNYNMMFLITESWDLSDEDKAFLLNTTPGAVRTMRSRLAKKKV